MDEIIGTTMHRESRDTIIPITRYERDEQEGELDRGEVQEEWKNVVEKLKQRETGTVSPLSSFPSSDEKVYLKLLHTSAKPSNAPLNSICVDAAFSKRFVP